MVFFELEVATWESIRQENNNAKRSLLMNKQSSCGGTSFPVAVCRGVSVGRASQHMSTCVSWVSEGYHLQKAQGLSLELTPGRKRL